MRSAVIRTESGLATIYLAASDSAAVTRAANWFDKTLKNNPQAGASQGNHYTLRFDPLEIQYTYSPLDCLVTVTKVDHI